MSKIVEEKKTKVNLGQTEFIILASVLLALLGLLLLFAPQIQLVYIVYTMGVAMVVLGIILIVRYFMTESYWNMNRYGFSVGVMFVTLGICEMLRAKTIAQYFILCLGVYVLVIAIVQLQNALDLKVMQDKLWLILLVFALASLICAMVIIMNPLEKAADLQTFTYIILVVEGVLSLVSVYCLSSRIRQYVKNIDTFVVGIEEEMEELNNNEEEL